MYSISSLLKEEAIDILDIDSKDLRCIIYCFTSKDFTTLINAVHNECDIEIKEKRIKLENTSNFPTFSLCVRFKEPADKAFFLLKAN